MSQSSSKPSRCRHCYIMYGNSIFDGLCSLCFKKNNQSNLSSKKQPHNQKPSTKLLSKAQSAEQKQDKIEKEGKKEEKISMKEKQERNEKDEGKNREKCVKCKKKTGMLGFTCRHCEENYCRLHRLPEDHSCDVDFITEGRKQLKIQNPTIPKQKIQQI